MTCSTQIRQDSTKYLISTIALLIINFLLMFLPFVEVYQPSYSKTVLGVTTYEDWYTQSAPMAMLVFPLFVTGIPYLCSIISLLVSLKKKNNKNSFIKIKNNTFNKPIRFFWLKFASIANAIAMWLSYSTLKSSVEYLEKHGAYCRITFFGFMNIICTIAFIVLLFVLSHKTKSVFILISKEQTEAAYTESVNENETTESEQ